MRSTFVHSKHTMYRDYVRIYIIIVLVGNKVCSKQSQSSDSGTFHLEGSHFTSWELNSFNFLEIRRHLCHNQFISNLCHLTFRSFGESTEKKNVFRGIQLVLQLPALCHYGLCETTKNRSIIITVPLKKMFSTTHIFFACLTTHFLHNFTFSVISIPAS